MTMILRAAFAAVLALPVAIAVAAEDPYAVPDAAPATDVLTEARGAAGAPALTEAPAAPVQVVPGGTATGLQWISDEQFDRQLAVVHGKVPHPEVGMFGPQSQMWRMLRYVAPGALGSGAALTLQISHPWVTAAIDEHSITRKDPLKRGRNTFRYLLQMIYGDRDQAMQAARDVRMIHDKVSGSLPYETNSFAAGSEYRANEVQAMIWVHATLWHTIVTTFEQSIEKMTPAEKERFYQETKLFAYMFGIPDEALPRSWPEFDEYVQGMKASGTLQATPASKELFGYLFGWHGFTLYLPLKYAKLAAAANLPPDLRQQYGLKYGPVRESFFKTTLWASRVGHKFPVGFITKNPVHKEAVARLRGERASWWTRLELRLALGQPALVNNR